MKICDNHVPLTFLRLETKMATLTAGDAFLQCIARVKNKPMFLLFMAELTITVLQHNFFYLFDSHSTNMHGLCVADGTSVLIKFGSLLEIEHYIQVDYSEYKDKIQSYFQIQFINVGNDRTRGLNILSYYQKVNGRLNYQTSSERIHKTILNKYRISTKKRKLK